jgi:hypothetical protein
VVPIPPIKPESKLWEAAGRGRSKEVGSGQWTEKKEEKEARSLSVVEGPGGKK